MDVASGNVLRIKMKVVAEARGEPKLTERPFPRAAGLKIFRIGLQNLSGDDGQLETWGCVKCLAKASQKAIPGPLRKPHGLLSGRRRSWSRPLLDRTSSHDALEILKRDPPLCSATRASITSASAFAAG